MEWQAHELTVRTILAYFPNSLALGWGDEADFQTFADQRPNKVLLEEFPNAPIWFSSERYLRGRVIVRTEATFPSIEQYKSFLDNAEASCDETFLSLMATYTFMPAFRRHGIDFASQAPSFQQKLNDLRVLIQVPDQIKTERM